MSNDPFLDWVKQTFPEAEIEGNVVHMPPGRFLEHECKTCGYTYLSAWTDEEFDAKAADWVCDTCTARRRASEAKTIYEVLIFHEDGGRRAVIREMIQGRWPKEVANFVCTHFEECDWLERHGKQPWHAYRRMTAIADENGEFNEITMHPPGNYPVLPRGEAAS